METTGLETLNAIATQKELTEEIEAKLKSLLESFKQGFKK
jgi:F0F1-type ATP synthase alpha subunit